MKLILYADYVNMLILFFSLACGIYRYSALDNASKIFFFLVGSSVFCESIAFFFAKEYQNNMPVYAIYSLVEFGLVSLYFNKIIDVFHKKKIGFYIGCVGIILGILNIIFLQGLNRFNSYFLFFEGLCIIIMALIAYFRLLLYDDKLRLYKYSHFWFTTILLLFWSITFLNWSLYNYVSVKFKEAGWIINMSILIVNMLTYISISCIFILYPKMQKSYE